MFTRRVVASLAPLSSQAGFTLRNSRNRFALILFLVATAVPTWAATLTVTNNADNGAGSLRAQITAAATGDTIAFAAALDGATISLTTYSNDAGCVALTATTCVTAGQSPGTEFGPSAFFISGSKTLTIDATANGLTKGVVIARSSAAGTANFRLFDVGVGSNLTLRGLTLSNGVAQGGGSNGGGGALGAGGAIFNQGTLTLQRCTLTGNIARGGQGGVPSLNYGGAGVGENATAFPGAGPNGGQDYSQLGPRPASPGGFGGGGGADFGATAGNGGFGGGGGLGRTGGAGGFGGGGGGGDTNQGGTNGAGGFGGGNAVDFGGAGAGLGGAIFNDAGAVSLTNVTLVANAANGGGNGAAQSGNGSGLGGAIFNYAGSLTLDFVTTSGNTVAPGTGGTGGSANGLAIYSLADSAAACGAGGNTCGSGNATLTMNHSIAADSGSGLTVVVVGAIHSGTSSGSGAYNAIGSAVNFTATNPVSGALLLGPLPAPPTGGLIDVLIPQVGSAAINAAGPTCSPATDQRGVARPQGAACDVGAVEVAPVNQATLTAIATPATIAFNGTSALSTTGGSGTGAVSFAVTTGGAFCSIVGSTLTGTGVGNCTVTATKAADASYNAATATVDVTVNMANQATLTAIATPAIIAFNTTSALSTTGGTGIGAVSYAVTAGGTFCSIVGSTLTGIGAGTCTVTATKAADINYNAATATVNVTVNMINQAALTAIATPASIVFNATSALSTTGGSGTGTVSFAVTAGNTFCAVTGSTLTGSGVGICTVTATKAADANYNAATATANVTVGKAATTTTITPPASITLGQSVSVTATVTAIAPGGGTPTGAVTISDGGAGVGDTCTITLPATSCSLTPSAVGNQPLTATYAGDINFTASNASGSLAVGTRPTAITLTSSPNPSRVGQPVILTATVTVLPAASSASGAGLKRAGDSAKAAAIPTGSVTFSDGVTVLGTVPLNASGVATFGTASLAQGSHTITALYSGDASTSVATITAVQQVDPVLPVPALSTWMLALLGLMLAGLTSLVNVRRLAAGRD